ncbi:hypothetical protein H6P81_011728 [Aristolochia fimbriata]|uniref:Uncharacterized protein n=1 Tax=Aristolochia fimbriata TaxID=158543 RepID=A0AAV7EBY6_ARIFI|nr:hypothetical protein H6P81_011728 [Aristolochia fimbriata]
MAAQWVAQLSLHRVGSSRHIRKLLKTIRPRSGDRREKTSKGEKDGRPAIDAQTGKFVRRRDKGFLRRAQIWRWTLWVVHLYELNFCSRVISFPAIPPAAGSLAGKVWTLFSFFASVTSGPCFTATVMLLGRIM